MGERAMSENERRRYFKGRDDWQEDHWQDHCGNPGCDHCDSDIPWENPVLAKKRTDEAAISRLTTKEAGDA